MKIVVIGGSGLIGTRLVSRLRAAGHEAVPASPSTGVNAVTGEGLAEAMTDAQAVVDVANSPSFEAKAVHAFFDTSTRNLVAAERAAGVGHHVVLSIVGLERCPEIDYFRAKLAQEALVKASGVPYTILRATQFFEFLAAIADAGTEDGVARLSSALLQPIAADDVAGALAGIASGEPHDATLEIAGPEARPLDRFAAELLAAMNDDRQIIADAHAHYFGAELNDKSLIPGEAPLLGATRFEDWLSRQTPQER